MAIKFDVSITDVIQASGSCLAAVGLFWTLILQRKATNAQVKATEDQITVNKKVLEQAERDYKRFIREIMPEVSFTAKSDPEKKSFAVIVKIEKNPAEKFIVEIPNKYEYTLEPSSLSEEENDMGVNVSIPFVVNYNVLPEHGCLGLRIHYKDSLGNSYQKVLSMSLNGTYMATAPKLRSNHISV